MAKILFGTAGIPCSTKKQDTVSGIERVAELGLGAMELEFVYGVNMGLELAAEVRKVAEKQDISLSVHAPYYINLNAKERAKLEASKKRILDSARIGAAAGAKIIVAHPGFYLGMGSEIAYVSVEGALMKIDEQLKHEGIEIKIGLETTGKGSQFGSLEEIATLSNEIDSVYPVIDFSHLHARGVGCLKEKKDFIKALGTVDKKFLKDAHFHCSGIKFTEKGERKHLNFDDAGNTLNYKLAIEALKESGVSGTVICESPNLEEDALKMQKYLRKIT
ncbi:MAG: TIM barrel protein [Candidatus Diapherotrites archaeon]